MPAPSPRATAPRLCAALAPVVAAVGYDLEDVEVRRAGAHSSVVVVVDRDSGVSLDDVADVSRACGEALDDPGLAGALPGGYTLEVTSPGVDRPLTAARHWRRNVGRLVAVPLRSGGSLTGRVTKADEATVTLETAVKGRVGHREVALAELGPGRVQVEFRRADAADPGADDDGLDDGLDDEDEDGDAT